MPWGKKEEEPTSEEGLQRTCHLCEKAVESRVWYARNVEEGRRKHKHVKRVYACPECYFDLDEDERKEYYRERL